MTGIVVTANRRGIPSLIKLYRIRGSRYLGSLARGSPLHRTNCHCIVASSPSRHNVSITLLCRQKDFGLLNGGDLSIPCGRVRHHPAHSVLRIVKRMTSNSALSIFIYRVPSHTNNRRGDRPCHLFATRVLGVTTSSVVGLHRRPGIVVVNSFGSCPAGGSVTGMLNTITPGNRMRTGGLCGLVSKHGRKACHCQNR